MAIQADIPPDLTNRDKALMFQLLNAYLNSQILLMSLHGIYTRILAVTLWNIFINKCWLIQRALVVIIILLHVLSTIGVATNWSFLCSAFIENGQSFWTISLKLTNANQAAYWEGGIPSLMSTILADLYIMWCCWMVWGQCWLVVLLPILSLISATVLKIMEIYLEYTQTDASYEVFLILYISFTLAMTLWCTLLIIFCILTVIGVRHRAALVLYLAFFIHSDFGFYYLDSIAAIVRGVAPMLLVGKAVAGHTHPTEEHDESATVSTLHFQMAFQSSQPLQPSTSSFQESTVQSAVLEVDIEAQRERSDELMVVVERTQ
ncbi:uncharacterized protein EV420DRAFT_1696533 [Desarmillaria tabescens]|uniref:Transmembrane protein n=1 Tax=Armillaria tabescens TaxID=1929756 RepID=A0AA39K3U7_ARMTA|nr:uncharacterized protein EV420DRAFT_1696533 [Desarmillaria tabescens]KAK0454015.1 hypothetical protein EV420DRAFT_1696533 [Desarmillaria tabescens]